MAGSNNLLWKFKGSTGPFNVLASVTLPCEVAQVREKLKVNFGLSESTSIDFVIYLDSDPEVVVSDYYVLPVNSKIYTRRCTSEEASALINNANTLFKSSGKDNVTFKLGNEGDDAGDDDEFKEIDFMFNMDDLYETSSKAETSNINEEEEELKIVELMKGQNAYDTNQYDSLSRRYYKNRTLLKQSNLSTSSMPITAGTTAAAGYSSAGTSGVQIPNRMYAHDMEDQSEIIPVDADYICHMCGERGHHIRNCTNVEGKRLSKKIRSSTGIPNDFLTPISFNDIAKYDEVYMLKDGTFAIMREAESVSGGAFFTKTVDQRIQVHLGISEKDSQALSKGFKCTICLCYFNNPVTTLCCGETFCLDCIIGKTNTTFTNKITCPTCRRNIKMTDLQANTSLKKTVQALILGNVDVLKNVNKEQETKEEETNGKTENKQDKISLFNIESLKRQKVQVDKYLAKYRTYKNLI
ncbi:uncharacterized protein TOT_020000338 [Theileria orientalis strain Shintoku]|uniref:RING-type domain-containing protein n=1 Tax=Theileria orientalis strain Shintoku TaxID=869250 RepID=J4DP46_THEOR|nr:uncharacterized protein TOT_020000338 [Theileria orientalis strain Shintoku]PVC51171.1 hypothetical protein MACL_00001763 [Theileria orientalis]BAM40074.1 uncharacterized protein TOT_020000338 [Theileria orientalis strain Shintoku]|eukprot:XP_009690375.1 uncharacterized protein TOT_020000338 [Theileria orientalis strain Shintoku]